MFNESAMYQVQDAQEDDVGGVIEHSPFVVPTCRECKQAFGYFKWTHTCKVCYQEVCNEPVCSEKNPGGKRTCTSCMKRLRKSAQPIVVIQATSDAHEAVPLEANASIENPSDSHNEGKEENMGDDTHSPEQVSEEIQKVKMKMWDMPDSPAKDVVKKELYAMEARPVETQGPLTPSIQNPLSGGSNQKESNRACCAFF